MSFDKHFFAIFTAFVLISVLFIVHPVAAEETGKESTVEKNKTEILKDIELFEQSLHNIKSCISRARTAEEINKCRMDETARRFQKVQDMLNEIDMTREERRLYELRPEK